MVVCGHVHVCKSIESAPDMDVIPFLSSPKHGELVRAAGEFINLCCVSVSSRASYDSRAGFRKNAAREIRAVLSH